jgi:hypothetical protein
MFLLSFRPADISYRLEGPGINIRFPGIGDQADRI